MSKNGPLQLREKLIFLTHSRRVLRIQETLSFFEAGWYAGNVYGAINGAHKYNRHATEIFLRNLDTRFHVGLPEARHTPILGVQFSLAF